MYFVLTVSLFIYLNQGHFICNSFPSNNRQFVIFQYSKSHYMKSQLNRISEWHAVIARFNKYFSSMKLHNNYNQVFKDGEVDIRARLIMYP